MTEDITVYVGLDVAKANHAVAVAENGQQGEVRFIGEIAADQDSVRRLVTRLGKKHGRLHFCYEAGPTGYGLYRQLIQLGHRSRTDRLRLGNREGHATRLTFRPPPRHAWAGARQRQRNSRRIDCGRHRRRP